MRVDLDAIHRAAPSPMDLALRLGLTPARGSRPDRCRVLCPAHDDRSPSCDVATRAGRIVWICRSCGAGGDLLALVAAVEGLDARLDFAAVVRRTAELVGVSIETSTTTRRPPRPVAIDLAQRIDHAADAWIAGRLVRDDEAIESATNEQIREAIELLDECDRMVADADRALDDLAPRILATIARREARALAKLSRRAA